MLILKTFVVLMYVLMIVMNFLANSLPLGGRTTGAISDKYPSLFTPAGFTFSIWGIIYVLLAIAVWQLVRTPQTDFTSTHTLVAWVLVVSSVFNVLWLVAWHHDRIVLSTAVMIALFATLMVGFLVTPTAWTAIRLAISVYFAWVSVALIANVTIMLVALDVPRLGIAEAWWLVGVLLVGLAVGLTTVLTRQDIPFGLVFIWAYWGILSRHLSSDALSREHPIAIATLFVSLVALLGVSVLRFWLNGYTMFGKP